MVTDLEHFLDLPADTPAPARRLAKHLGDLVRAATAGDVGMAWESALPCRRRPGNRACPGRLIALRPGSDAPIRWQCSACADAGVISNWAGSIFDLRPRALALAPATHDHVIPHEIAAALRDLHLLDPDSERLVFRIRAHPAGAALSASDDDVEDLLGAIAAEANHEPDRRRRQRLDAAFQALNSLSAAGR